MAIISCFKCLSDNDIHLEGTAPDGTRILRCGECGHTWTPKVPMTAPTLTRSPFEMAKGRFATSAMVERGLMARVARLKKQYLKTDAGQSAEVDEYWSRYQAVFSRKGLAACAPRDLRNFANDSTGADAGNVFTFNRTWKLLGDEAAAERTRATIEYLVRGPATIPVEDRLTHLINDHAGTGMPGFKEPLLTKVLCIAEPRRFLPLLTYGAEGTGKRDLTLAVYGLHLPKVDQTSMQIGRLATWSNDLLLELVGDGFTSTQHAARFLLWAKDRVGQTVLTAVR